MAEHATVDEEERAWATRLARAFLAPPEPALVAPDEGPRTAVVALVAVVPVAVPVPADQAWGERREARGDEEPGEAGS